MFRSRIAIENNDFDCRRIVCLRYSTRDWFSGMWFFFYVKTGVPVVMGFQSVKLQRLKSPKKFREYQLSGEGCAGYVPNRPSGVGDPRARHEYPSPRGRDGRKRTPKTSVALCTGTDGVARNECRLFAI